TSEYYIAALFSGRFWMRQIIHPIQFLYAFFIRTFLVYSCAIFRQILDAAYMHFVRNFRMHLGTFGILVLWDFGTLRFWDFEILVLWDFGTLGFWVLRF